MADANPVWIFYRQTGHCQKGMFFAINPGDQFAAFQATAMGIATPSVSATATASATAMTPSSSQDHRIIVSGSSLTFQPANITAQPGDTITFEFHQKNHTITQSSLAMPCQKLAFTSASG